MVGHFHVRVCVPPNKHFAPMTVRERERGREGERERERERETESERQREKMSENWTKLPEVLLTFAAEWNGIKKEKPRNGDKLK